MCASILGMIRAATDRQHALDAIPDASIQNGCRVCHHPEAGRISKALIVARQSPRAVSRRYSDITRKDLAHHRDVCVKSTVAGGVGVHD